MKPLKVQLLSMPFAALDAPSLGLTQLRGKLQRQFGAQVAVEIHYATFNLVEYFRDSALYGYALSSTGFATHLGDWFFAGAAFPEARQDVGEYLERYYPESDRESQEVRRLVAQYRPAVESYLDHVIDSHRLLESDAVGLTSMFLQNTASIALARRLKERNPAVVTVMGGAACEGDPGLEFARRIPSIDFVFSGPALVSFPAFIGHLLNGEISALHRINGVFSKCNHSGDFNPDREPEMAMRGDEADIDDLIPLNYEGFLNAYEGTFGKQNRSPYLLFETSRGCWWGDKSACSFCGLNGPQPCHWAMSPHAAIRQIQLLYPYAKRARCFVATDNIMPRDYPEQVFARLRPPPGFAMKYETRAGLDLHALKQLHRAHVVALQPGIESLSTTSLARMCKGTTAFQNLRFLKACVEVPVAVEWNLLVGVPGEPVTTYEKMLRDIPLLYHLPPPQGAFPVMFVRYSRYHEDPGRFGLELAPCEIYSHIYPCDATSLERIATFFINRAPEAAPYEPWLEPLNEAIREWQRRWSGADGKEGARLRLINSGKIPFIHDSRSGKVIRHEVSGSARLVLECLEHPKVVDSLRNELSGTDIDVEREQEWLRQRSLLFEENGEAMSLVLVERAEG